MKGDFELLARDGLARICSLETAHGKVQTPALLPVINPSRLAIAPAELSRDFGIQMIITNAYIIYRDQKLREKALKEGLHGLLNFQGPVMTDSGTFQTHVYKSIEIDPQSILKFQIEIGSDVATVFDVFSEPEFSHEKAEKAVEITVNRTIEALQMDRGNSLLSSTVQGSLYSDLRRKAAERISGMGIDYCNIGGVVPLMERHRFRELVSVIEASIQGMNRGKPVHLFGAGHPAVLPFAVLLGCDLFDSSSYVKFAYEGRMMFETGSIRLDDIRQQICFCPECTRYTPQEMRSMPYDDRLRFVSRHNMHVLCKTLEEIKQAIFDGNMWNLVQERMRSNPELFDAFASIVSSQVTDGYEPITRKSGFNVCDELSLSIPPLRMALERAATIRPGKGDRLLVVRAAHPYFSHFDFSFSNGADVACLTPAGIIPLHLTETFPFAQSLFSERLQGKLSVSEYSNMHGYISCTTADWRSSSSPVPEEEYLSQALAVLEFQFGRRIADAFRSLNLHVSYSERSRKLRSVHEGSRRLLFFRTADGLFNLTLDGGKIILPTGMLRVVCMDDAVPFVAEGKSLFCRFVAQADERLRPGDECIVVDREGKLVACGRALLSGREMLSFKRGVAVEIREGSGARQSSQPPERMQ